MKQKNLLWYNHNKKPFNVRSSTLGIIQIPPFVKDCPRNGGIFLHLFSEEKLT